MGAISLTKLYDLLSIKVGKETAENLTTFIEEKVKDEVDNKSQLLATKHDIAGLEIKFEKVFREIADVRENAASNKSEVIKWMFIFWVGQVAATFGFILLFLKK